MKNTILLFLLTILFSCSVPHYPKKYEKQGIFSNDSIQNVVLNNEYKNTLQIQYLGCGNLLIKNQNDVIAIDPFFSNNSGIKTAFGKIKFNQNYFNKGTNLINRFNIDYKDINSIFISHSHYDHLLDLAYLLEKGLVNKNINIYGDNSTRTIVKNFIVNYTFNNADSFVFKNEVNPKWINIKPNMRMLIIPSSHAPHFGKIHLMKGHSDSNYFNNFINSTQKLNANQFKEGNTYAFILDIMQSDTIAFRALIKGAGCEINNGEVSKEILKEHSIDLAILQIASANFTDCYPQNLLNQIKPKKVILTHWEDFFKPYAPEKIKTVRATNFNYFLSQVRKTNIWSNTDLKDVFYMGKPGTMFNVNY
jgi:hypothetical protein